MKQLRKKIPANKLSKEKNLDDYLGEYTPSIKSMFLVKYVPLLSFIMFMGLFLFMAWYSFNINNPLSYIYSACFLGLTVFFMFIFRSLLNSSIKLTLEKNKMMFLPRLGKEYVISYQNITSFNRKYTGQGYDYFFTAIIDGKQKKLYLGNMENLSKVIFFLKQKLKNVPQTDITTKKKWAVDRSY